MKRHARGGRDGTVLALSRDETLPETPLPETAVLAARLPNPALGPDGGRR